MKKTIAGILALAVVLSFAAPAVASRHDNLESDTHPLRVVGYVVHGAGQFLNYFIFRPIHWAVSRPDMDIVFGHKARMGEEDTYFEWLHGDYEPSVGTEMSNRAAAVQKK